MKQDIKLFLFSNIAMQALTSRTAGMCHVIYIMMMGTTVFDKLLINAIKKFPCLKTLKLKEFNTNMINRNRFH